jgi:gliding motility-associated-like protein
MGESAPLWREVERKLIIKSIQSVLPNPFTPNGDGINDVVEFKIAGLLENRGEVSIYNFRGRKVRGLAGEKLWNGKSDTGEDLPLGVYLYIVKVDGTIKARGTLTLVR